MVFSVIKISSITEDSQLLFFATVQSYETLRLSATAG